MQNSKGQIDGRPLKTSRGCTNIKTILGIQNQRGRTLGWCLCDVMTIRFAPFDGPFLEIRTARFSKHRLGTTAPMLEEEDSVVPQHPCELTKPPPPPQPQVRFLGRVSLVIWTKTIWSKRNRGQVLTSAQIFSKFLTLHSLRRASFGRHHFVVRLDRHWLMLWLFWYFFNFLFCHYFWPTL